MTIIFIKFNDSNKMRCVREIPRTEYDALLQLWYFPYLILILYHLLNGAPLPQETHRPTAVCGAWGDVK